MKFFLYFFLTLMTLGVDVAFSYSPMKFTEKTNEPFDISAPKLTNNPRLDIIATNKKPLLSFFNARGGVLPRKYTIQIDKVPTFDSDYRIEYRDVPEENKYLASKLVETDLDDNHTYYWRVRARDSQGNYGPWASSRFFLDTESDKSFMNLTRIPVKKIFVSSGFNHKNIMDLDDPGQASYWQSTPPGSLTQWVVFDLAKEWEVSRIWMLSNTSSPCGWMKNFVWQISDDGKNWNDIAQTKTLGNETYRNIINFPSVTTRYLRLYITDWVGFAPQVNAIVLYSPQKPMVPTPPEEDYVLVVGDQMNGFTFTELAQFIEDQDLGLKTLTVPHYEVSLEMIEKLEKKPVAIVLSGNNADYSNLPMFEYNGVYEIIRDSNIPILGICCGHQLTVMAYGYTYARSMGWEDITSLENYKKIDPIRIKKEDPIFKNIPPVFTAPEIHGWAVVHLPKDYEVLAASDYIQAIRSKSKMLYGEQFHAEIKTLRNLGTPYLINFLKMAKKHKKKLQSS